MPRMKKALGRLTPGLVAFDVVDESLGAGQKLLASITSPPFRVTRLRRVWSETASPR